MLLSTKSNLHFLPEAIPASSGVPLGLYTVLQALLTTIALAAFSLALLFDGCMSRMLVTSDRVAAIPRFRVCGRPTDPDEAVVWFLKEPVKQMLASLAMNLKHCTLPMNSSKSGNEFHYVRVRSTRQRSAARACALGPHLSSRDILDVTLRQS